jgi:hypothetical protein
LACALIGFGCLSVLACLQYSAANFSYDVGNILQAFHRSLDGAWMQGTVNGGETNISRWESHTEFIFAALVPLFALLPHAATLFLAQAAALAAGGWAVFSLARERWGEGWQAFLCSLAYWSFPFLFNLQLSGLHSDPFFIAPYLLAWQAHKSGGGAGRPGRFWAWILVATSVKEYACIFNFLLGAVISGENRKRAYGLWALSFGQFLILTPVTNLLFRASGLRLNLEAHNFPAGQGVSAVSHVFAANLADPAFVPKLLAMVALFGWSWIRYPKGLLLAGPIFLALTLVISETLFIDHHFALLMPALFIGMVEALATVSPDRRKLYLSAGLLAPSLGLLLAHPDSPASLCLREVYFHPEYRNPFHYRVTPHDRIADTLLAGIPKGLAVASEHDLRPKLADREWAFIHPHPFDSLRADRYVFDFFETTGLIPHEDRRARCSALLRSPDFSLAAFTDGLLLLAKGRDLPHSLPASRFAWETVTDITKPEPESAAPAAATRPPDRPPAAPGTPGIPVTVRASLARDADGYRLEAEYLGSFGPAEAVVSVFTGPSGDSLRVLHLPGYLFARLSRLPPGRYRETLAFRGPANLLDGSWKWELRFHAGSAYLPLAGRADQILERRPLGMARPGPVREAGREAGR